MIVVAGEYFNMFWLRGKCEQQAEYRREGEREREWCVIGLNTIIIMSQFRAAQAPH